MKKNIQRWMEKLKISAVMNLKTSKGDERKINNMNWWIEMKWMNEKKKNQKGTNIQED
jgi:hypothetical protein